MPDAEGIILHSDLRSQYTSDEFENYLQSQGMLHSFDRKGNPYDIPCILSFCAEKEEVYTTTYQTFKEAKTACFEYIDLFYNRKMHHTALGYKIPQQVEGEPTHLKTTSPRILGREKKVQLFVSKVLT